MQSHSHHVRSRPLARTVLAPLVIVVALLCSVLAFAPAQADDLPPNSTISGTVTDSANRPIADVRVDFYEAASYGYVGSARTSDTGTYTMRLYSGDYRIGFYTEDEYVSEFWDDTADYTQAAAVTVGTTPVTGKDAVLARSPIRISGAVTGPGGVLIADADVTIYKLDAGTWKRSGGGVTNRDGRYDLGTLPGTYRLGFTHPEHRPEFYDNASTVEAGQSIVVGASGVAGLSTELALNPAVTGRVTGPDGQPIADVTATIYGSDGSGGWKEISTDRTAGNGSYTVRAPEGSYKLGFSTGDHVHTAEFYDDKATLASSDTIALTSAGVEARDARLALNPRVEGTLSGPGGADAKDVRVVAYAPDGNGGWTPSSFGETEFDGTYSVPVEPGTYRLGFAEFSGRFAEEFWNDKPTVEDATSFTVGATDVGGKDAVLTPFSSIRGTVTGPGGQPVRAHVRAYQRVTVDGATSWSATYDTVAKADGSYALPVAPGTYSVGFSSDQLQTEFWNDKPTVETADPITVTAGIDVTGRSAQLAAQAVLSGTISGPAGGVAGAEVDVLRDIGGGTYSSVAGTETTAGGAYSLPVAAGTYRLRFSKPGLVTEYFDDAATVQSAANVVVGTSDLSRSAKLAAAASIKGTVTATTGGAALAGITVTAEGVDQQTVATTTTASNGTYALPVSPGSYRVRFTDPGGARITEYWRDAPDFGRAQAVTVGSTDVGSISPSLASNAAVTGLVTGRGNAPLADVDVTLLSRYVDSGGEYWLPVATATTRTDGSYAVGAEPGTYRIRFDAPSAAYQTEFWDDKTSVATATDNALTSAGLTRNAQLAAPAGITGTVRAANGTPLAGIEVSAYRGETSEIDPDTTPLTAVTDSAGAYRLPVGAGSFKIGFASPSLAYAPEFWDDAATVAAATPITVDRADVGGKDARLAVGTGITGTVTGAAQNVQITAFRLDPSSQRWSRVTSRTAANGAYSLALPAGTYRIGFDDFLSDPVYWRNATSFNVAQTITVGATGVTSGIDVSFVIPLTNSVAPSATGTPVLGATLTADEGAWSPTVDRFEYQWLRGGTPIPGATSRTYVITPADVSSAMSVRVTGFRSGFSPVSTPSAPTGAVVDTGGNISPPQVIGEAFFGATLTAFDGTWGSGAGMLSRQWLRDGTPTGQTGPTYALGRADQGATIQLRVTPSADPARSQVSTATRVIKADASVELSFTRKGKKVRLSIKVTSDGVRPTGKVTVKAGGKKIKTVTLKRGKASFTLPRQKKGTTTYRASYAGDARTMKITGMGKLRVK